MDRSNTALFDGAVAWLCRTNEVKSAVLFGSSAATSRRHSDGALDLDLHLIVSSQRSFERIDWKSAIPNEVFCFQACRPATGRVRKVTVVFESGQIDMVLVPLGMMRVAAIFFRTGLYTKVSSVSVALHEMSTCLRTGFRFIKGESRWQRFYNNVSALPGVRLADVEVLGLADASICDVLWVFQKIEDGELIAAQHILHSRISDTNLRLWRELRCRRGLSLPSFGLGRRIEFLARDGERETLSLSSRLERGDLRRSASQALQALRLLMVSLEPKWSVPELMQIKLNNFSAGDERDPLKL
jgi:hypothetical protein